jgi:hypothetical protein
MFKLDPDPTFPFTANITVPGQATPAQLNLVGRHKTRQAMKDWIERANTGVPDAQYLGEAIAGWGDDVLGGDGTPAPFTPEAFEALLDRYSASGIEIFHAYTRALGESRSKN